MAITAAVATMILGGTAALAQSNLISAGSLSMVGVQAATEAYRQSDFRLSQSIGLRVETVGGADRRSRAALIDPRAGRRRFSSTFDYYPIDESGFHLSIGMHGRPKPGRAMSLSAISTDLRSRLDGPSTTTALRVREDVRRKSPVALAGWSTMVGETSSLRFDAGAMAVRYRRLGGTLAMADNAGGRPRGMGIGPTAQISFLHRF